MIYFLVNNDYQLVDARQHLPGLNNEGFATSLIEVPHCLNTENRGEGFSNVYSFSSPLKSHRWLGAWARYFYAWKKIARSLRPTSCDVLFVYTEFELLNHFIARQFKRAGARVYLVEDGGFATYIPLSLPGDETLSLKERVVAAMTKKLPGLKDTQFHKVNGVVFPWLPDAQIDGVFVYRHICSVRQLPVLHLRRHSTYKHVKRQHGRVIFLNERMYDFYQTPFQYFEGLGRIITGLTQGFDEVFFKFHPSEVSEWSDRIRDFLKENHPAVRLIEDKRGIEILVDQYQPEVLASYFSAALLNLDGSEIEPMYLYHLIDEIASQKVFVQVTALLQQWGYKFVDGFDELGRGYHSGLFESRSPQVDSLAQLVKYPR